MSRLALAALLWRSSLSSAVHLEVAPREKTPSSDDSTLVLIAGRAKCGTTHLHQVLRSHPDVFALRKELCPATLGESEQDFADVLKFTAAQALPDGGHSHPLDADTMALRCVEKFGEPWAKTCSGLYEGAEPGGTERRSVVLQSCIDTEAVLGLQRLAPVPRAKVVYLQRDPADLSWASYNFWQGDFDAPEIRLPAKGVWSQPGNYRTPEHFHELVASRGRLGGAVTDWREYIGIDLMKSLRHVFGDANVLFLRSEDLPQTVAIGWLTDFLGLKMELIPKEVLSEIDNSQALLDDRGIPADVKTRARKLRSKRANLTAHLAGEYEISGYRGMLCETRKVIYEDCRKICFEMYDDFQLYYPYCLGVEPLDC